MAEQTQIKKESTYFIQNLFDSNDKTLVTLTVHPDFYQEPPRKQRKAAMILMWWSIKHYFETIFKM